jgi:hypothetical protein
MPKLVLTGFHKALYDDKTACAYIAYGTVESPEDQFGHQMGDFYQEPFAFLSHLETKIKPILNKQLSMTPYTALRVDFTNQAPHPHFVIGRSDKAVLTDNDLKQIEECVLSAIASINKNTKFLPGRTYNSGLHKPRRKEVKETETETTAPTDHRSLRQ